MSKQHDKHRQFWQDKGVDLSDDQYDDLVTAMKEYFGLLNNWDTNKKKTQ